MAACMHIMWAGALGLFVQWRMWQLKKRKKFFYKLDKDWFSVVDLQICGATLGPPIQATVISTLSWSCSLKRGESVGLGGGGGGWREGEGGDSHDGLLHFMHPLCVCVGMRVCVCSYVHVCRCVCVYFCAWMCVVYTGVCSVYRCACVCVVYTGVCVCVVYTGVLVFVCMCVMYTGVHMCVVYIVQSTQLA